MGNYFPRRTGTHGVLTSLRKCLFLSLVYRIIMSFIKLSKRFSLRSFTIRNIRWSEAFYLIAVRTPLSASLSFLTNSNSAIMLFLSVFQLLLVLSSWAWGVYSTETQERIVKDFFDKNGSPAGSGSTSTHTNNWAVLVSSSRYWFNYRVCCPSLCVLESIWMHILQHMANALGM